MDDDGDDEHNGVGFVKIYLEYLQRMMVFLSDGIFSHGKFDNVLIQCNSNILHQYTQR